MPRIKKPECMLREERIVKALKTGLINKGWTVKHLSELMNTDVSGLSRTINHPMSVKLETVLKVADKLGLDSLPV